MKYLDYESIPGKTSINKVIISLSLHEESYINSELWVLSAASYPIS